MSEIRVLAVRQPWASLIVEGLKTIEVRSKPTNIRGKVAIYASLSTPSDWDFRTVRQNIAELSMKHPEKFSEYDFSIGYPIGQIIGTVEITESYEMSDFVLADTYNEHFSPKSYDYNFGWELKKPVKFPQPIPYKPPKGAVIWSKTELPEGIQ